MSASSQPGGAAVVIYHFEIFSSSHFRINFCIKGMQSTLVEGACVCEVSIVLAPHVACMPAVPSLYVYASYAEFMLNRFSVLFLEPSGCLPLEAR